VFTFFDAFFFAPVKQKKNFQGAMLNPDAQYNLTLCLQHFPNTTITEAAFCRFMRVSLLFSDVAVMLSVISREIAFVLRLCLKPMADVMRFIFCVPLGVVFGIDTCDKIDQDVGEDWPWLLVALWLVIVVAHQARMEVQRARQMAHLPGRKEVLLEQVRDMFPDGQWECEDLSSRVFQVVRYTDRLYGRSLEVLIQMGDALMVVAEVWGKRNVWAARFPVLPRDAPNDIPTDGPMFQAVTEFLEVSEGWTAVYEGRAFILSGTQRTLRIDDQGATLIGGDEQFTEVPVPRTVDDLVALATMGDNVKAKR
jgi:hypothetical protein